MWEVTDSDDDLEITNVVKKDLANTDQYIDGNHLSIPHYHLIKHRVLRLDVLLSSLRMAHAHRRD